MKLTKLNEGILLNIYREGTYLQVGEVQEKMFLLESIDKNPLIRKIIHLFFLFYSSLKK